MVIHSYDAVLFDLLTALLDSRTLWNHVAGSAENGRRWRAEYLALSYATGPYRPYNDLTAEAAEAVGLSPNLSAQLDARYAELAPWPEANEVLRTLKSRGVKLSLVTNCSERLGRLAASRLAVDFDTIVTAERAGFYKPRPEPYLQALQELHTTPDRALFVAGSAYDLFGTSKIGLTTYWHDRLSVTPPPGTPRPQMRERSLLPLIA